MGSWVEDEDGDIATLWAGVPRQRSARERDVRSESELVDEEPIADKQRRLHASAWNPEGLRKQWRVPRKIAITGRRPMMNARARTTSDGRGLLCGARRGGGNLLRGESLPIVMPPIEYQSEHEVETQKSVVRITPELSCEGIIKQ